MSKELKEAMKESIIILLSQGYSNRKIAELLQINRKTVNKYARIFKRNGPEAPTGSDIQNGPKVPAGSGSRSRCARYHETITKLAVGRGLSAVRIYNDLRAEYGYSGSYDSVKRYIRRLCLKEEVPFRRIETSPGEEAQVDFGQGGWIVDESGRRRRPHVLCVTLSHSRASYCEAVPRQTTECFIRALENAFRHFGGVVKYLIIDNLRAAVKNHDWFDPELNHKVLDFASHYGTVFLPTRPYTPEHKGKVESTVKYVQNNALKGRVFSSLSEQNEFLRKWQRNVADTRIHGTTRKQVRKAFEEEKEHLQPLPPDLFPCFEEGKRKVHRDGYAEVAGSYYSVPAEYCRREVMVRWDSRCVRIFNMRFRQIACHVRVEPGKYSTDKNHIPEKKISAAERGSEYYLRQAREIGENTEKVVKEIFRKRNVKGYGPVTGVLALKKKYGKTLLENACAEAVQLDACDYRSVKHLIGNTPGHKQEKFSFMTEHENIRPLENYSKYAVWNEESRSARMSS